jgi:hypothetical protein
MAHAPVGQHHRQREQQAEGIELVVGHRRVMLRASL